MSSSNKAEQQSVGEFVTCELRDYGVKINYPSNWYKSEQGLKPPLLVGFRSPKEHPSDTYFENVTLSLSTIGDIKLEQFIQAGIRDLKNKYGDSCIIESVPTRLAGREGYKIVYDANGKRFMHLTTIKGNNAYHLIYVAQISNYDSYLPVAQKMTDSFEITK